MSKQLANKVFELCAQKKWSGDWGNLVSYLHIKSSHLAEAMKSKDSLVEASGDVLIALMCITENYGISWDSVIRSAESKIEKTLFHTPEKERPISKQVEPNGQTAYIAVNGFRVTCVEKSLSYFDVVKYAFNGVPNQKVSVTYRFKNSESDVEMKESDVVNVQSGMIFSVKQS